MGSLEGRVADLGVGEDAERDAERDARLDRP